MASHPVQYRSRLAWAVIVALASVVSARVPTAQPANPQAATIQCADSATSGTIGNTPCTIFAKRTVQQFAGGADAVAWSVTAFATRSEADSRHTPTSALVELDQKFWLLDVTPGVGHDDHSGRKSTISPIPLPRAQRYEIVYAYVAVPPGAHSATHVQSGPEAWYVLSGSQCVETPDTVLHINQGGGGMVPADTPLYLVATGTTTRRAFFVIVHDANRPFYTEIDSWHPRGRCGSTGATG